VLYFVHSSWVKWRLWKAGWPALCWEAATDATSAAEAATKVFMLTGRFWGVYGFCRRNEAAIKREYKFKRVTRHRGQRGLDLES